MFNAIMDFVIDMHIKDLDNTETGIMGRIDLLNKFLKVVDFEIWKKLNKEKINPQFYSFRWLALLMAQDFEIL